MTRFMTTLLFITLVIGILILPAPSIAGPAQISLTACTDGGFSTEEDFMMIDGVYVSDGDLLSFNGQVCARNADLLASFYPNSDLPADLGLDAVDILDIDNLLVAFSTELDDPGGNFTAGDLLLTNGAIIPNAAFVNSFDIKHDIGFDAVHFVGEVNNILDFADVALELGPDGWGGGRLQEELSNFDIDIWFSIEGTHPPGDVPDILDGDLLSAIGLPVASNSALLPTSTPAGIPVQGVDFGLDAATTFRRPGQEPFIKFSTEILYREEPGFNDGDVLVQGNGVIIFNQNLTAPFQPAADFLGLDALSILDPTINPGEPHIQVLCDKSLAGFDGGFTLPDAVAGTGLYHPLPTDPETDQPPRRPCGKFVPIDGYLPPGIDRFRVAYRRFDEPFMGVGVHPGIRTDWTVREQAAGGVICQVAPTPLGTDLDGWMNTTAYLDARAGNAGYCTNAELRLAVWDTNNDLGYGPPDPNGHYRIWLEWDVGGVFDREEFDHMIQLDNTPPVVNNLQVTLQDGTTPVGTCGEAPPGESIFQVHADFADDYYWGYRLEVSGGDPAITILYPHPPEPGDWHNYYDGTLPVAYTDDTGTTPDGDTVFLREIDMTDFGESFTNCCYLLKLWVRDATIRHNFVNGYNVSLLDPWTVWEIITFSAGP